MKFPGSAAVAAVVFVGLVTGLSGCGSSSSSTHGHASVTSTHAKATTTASASASSGSPDTTGASASTITTSIDPNVAASLPAGASPGAKAAAPDADFCKQVTADQQQLAQIDPTKTTPDQRLAASKKVFAVVSAAAPKSIKSDLETVNNFVAAADSIDVLAGPMPTRLTDSLQRVVAWFSTNCGIALSVG